MSDTEINALPAVLSSKPHNRSGFVLTAQMRKQRLKEANNLSKFIQMFRNTKTSELIIFLRLILAR